MSVRSRNGGRAVRGGNALAPVIKMQLGGILRYVGRSVGRTAEERARGGCRVFTDRQVRWQQCVVVVHARRSPIWHTKQRTHALCWHFGAPVPSWAYCVVYAYWGSVGAPSRPPAGGLRECCSQSFRAFSVLRMSLAAWASFNSFFRGVVEFP